MKTDKELNRQDIDRITEETIKFIKERTGENAYLIDLVLNQGLNRGYVGGQLFKAYSKPLTDDH